MKLYILEVQYEAAMNDQQDALSAANAGSIQKIFRSAGLSTTQKDTGLSL
ncbi:hypothetical protein QW131_03980 [Roseibium salinum]|nr:hypothetical protein [Roseibium salinum]